MPLTVAARLALSRSADPATTCSVSRLPGDGEHTDPASGSAAISLTRTPRLFRHWDTPLETPYDAVLLVSFGGPEKPDDVIPFLENVLRGRNVPRERLLEVAEHYELFGGVSPINEQNRALLAALLAELNSHGPHLPVYWGNRNWHPFLADTIQQMADDGIRRGLAFVTSAFASYSGCRQYLEDIERARQQVGSQAPVIDKLRLFYNHPGFIEPLADRVAAALSEFSEAGPDGVELVFTAHSLPMAMAEKCAYEAQLREACTLVCAQIDRAQWRLAYQSRSGPPSQPWLEPDILDVLEELHGAGRAQGVVVAPIGFLSDHMEVVYDLDVEARQKADELGLEMVRAATVGTHPRFVQMIRELIVERTDPNSSRPALGQFGPGPDVCPPGCCPPR